MNPFKKVLAILFLALTFLAFRPLKVDKYSIDSLPESWKSSKSVVAAIDVIIPATVSELDKSVACVGCEADYSVSLLMDSIIVLKQTVKDISEKKNNEGFAYECTTVYHFKSSLAVYNKQNTGIAKLLVTDPVEDEFVSKRKFNIPREKGKTPPTAEQYMAAHASEVGPSQQDLIDNAEKKVYKLKDQVSKMLKRRL